MQILSFPVQVGKLGQLDEKTPIYRLKFINGPTGGETEYEKVDRDHLPPGCQSIYVRIKLPNDEVLPETPDEFRQFKNRLGIPA